MHHFTIKETLRVGWDKTIKHFWFLLVVMAGTLVVTWVPGLILGGGNQDQFNAAAFILFLINFIIGIFIQAGWIRITLKILDDVRGGWRDFMLNSKTFWNMVGGTILYTLITFAGFLLLIVPGIIWGIKYRFYSYLILDKGMSAVDALKESGRITQGEKMNIFLYCLAAALVALAGILALLIGLVVALPIIAIGFAYIYRRLSGGAPHSHIAAG